MIDWRAFLSGGVLMYKTTSWSTPNSSATAKAFLEDPQLGLDKFGDIKIGLNQLPIIRGGWSDRNEVYYSTDIKDNNISSVNIIIDEVIDENLSNQIMAQNKNILINDERKS